MWPGAARTISSSVLTALGVRSVALEPELGLEAAATADAVVPANSDATPITAGTIIRERWKAVVRRVREVIILKLPARGFVADKNSSALCVVP
jgi:hypothetical protein